MLADRIEARWLVIGSMLLLATGMVLVQFVTPGLLAVVYAVCIGTAGGSIRALEAALFPQIFGLAHVGSIRGAVMSLNVGATAFGPLALASGFGITGAYSEVLMLLLVLPAAVIVLTCFARRPDRPRRERPVRGRAGVSR